MGPMRPGLGVGAAAGSAGVAGAGVWGVEEVSVCAAAIRPAARARDAVSVRRPDLKSIKVFAFSTVESGGISIDFFRQRFPCSSREGGLRRRFDKVGNQALRKGRPCASCFGLPVIISLERHIVYVVFVRLIVRLRLGESTRSKDCSELAAISAKLTKTPVRMQ